MQSVAAATFRMEDQQEKKQVIFLGLMHASGSRLKQPKNHQENNQVLFGDSENDFEATDGINNYLH